MDELEKIRETDYIKIEINIEEFGILDDAICSAIEDIADSMVDSIREGDSYEDVSEQYEHLGELIQLEKKIVENMKSSADNAAKVALENDWMSNHTMPSADNEE